MNWWLLVWTFQSFRGMALVFVSLLRGMLVTLFQSVSHETFTVAASNVLELRLMFAFLQLILMVFGSMLNLDM